MSLFSPLMSLYPSIHKLVNGLLVIDLQKLVLVLELVLGARIHGAYTDLVLFYYIPPPPISKCALDLSTPTLMAL